MPSGVNWNPKAYSGRIILLSLLIFTMMFYQFYSGVLVSILLSSPPRTINTIEDLVHCKLKFGMENVEMIRRYFTVYYYI